MLLLSLTYLTDPLHLQIFLQKMLQTTFVVQFVFYLK